MSFSFFPKDFSSKIRRSVYRILFGIDRTLSSEDPIVIVFAYHSIASDSWRFSIDRDVFVRQIEHLLSIRKPVTLSDVAAHIAGKKYLKDSSFVICFDDGYRDILTVKKFLAEKNICPAVFVLSGPERADVRELGTQREFLHSADILDLHRAGWEIGCHSATHADMWAMSEDEIRKETIGAKQKLENELGIPVPYFAYPRGRYTDTVKRIVREAGYELALSMDDGIISPKTNRFAIPRVGVDRTHTLKEFETIFSSASIQFRRFVKFFYPI